MNRVITAILLLIIVSMVGCSSPTSVQVGILAPEFQLPNLEGQPISLSEFRGKPLLVNFWTTWCGPCRYELPFIQAIFEERPGELVVLAIDIGEDPSTVKNFIQNGNFSFPVLLDINEDVALEYNIRGIPTSFLIDKDGIIQEIKVGPFINMMEIGRSMAKIIPS